MNNAEQKGRFLEICLHQNFPPGPDYFPNNKQKAFVENIKRVAKEFYLEVIWKEHKDAMFLL